MSKKEEDKARYEQTIFTEFVEAANLDVDMNSLKSERPPKPDINCTISGERHYFELTEITDQDLARNVSISLKTLETTGGAYSDDEPLVRAFSSKAVKAQNSYTPLDGKLELLAYYDKQYPPLELQAATKEHLYWVTQNMVLLGPWSRLWIYDTWNKRVLWMCETG
jgi:hypothetical protein